MGRRFAPIIPLTPEQKQMVEDSMGLAYETAGKIKHSRNYPLDYDEILSICFSALIKSVQGYDPNKGFAFSTYAVNKMKWSVYKELNPKKPQIKALYLEGLLPDEDDVSWQDLIADKNTLEDTVINNVFVEQIAEKIKRIKLAPKIKKALTTHLVFPDLNQGEIAELVGCSQAQVSRAYKILAERCESIKDDIVG